MKGNLTMMMISGSMLVKAIRFTCLAFFVLLLLGTSPGSGKERCAEPVVQFNAKKTGNETRIKYGISVWKIDLSKKADREKGLYLKLQ
jgi:hypothetical protein